MALPRLDADSVRGTIQDLRGRDLDLGRLAGIRDELASLELPSVSEVRRELARLDLPSTTDLRREFERIERELPDVGRLLHHRPPKPTPWLQMPSTAVVLGAVALVAGTVLGGVLAWLYQPDRGVQRRKALRRRLHKLQRTIQHRS